MTIAGTLFPIFSVILLGYCCRRAGFPGDGFWQPAERLTYYVLFPALLIQKIAAAQVGPHSVPSLALALVVAVLVVSAVLLLLRPLLTSDRQAFTSLYQGTVRFNTYIGLSIIIVLFGRQGMVLAAVIIAILIPLVNLLSVSVLSHFGGSGPGGIRRIVLALARNPVVIACLAGIALNAANVRLPRWGSEFLLILGRASLPLGLLTVGAGLELKAARTQGFQITAACFLKLIVMPAVMWIACSVFRVAPLPTAVAVLFGALPGSALSFILARQLGGDSRLMAGIVTIQTCVSMVTIPIVLSLLQGHGLFN